MQYITEGSWAFPHVHSAVVKLEKLLDEPLSAKKAIAELYDIFGNDELFDVLEDNKETTADVRDTVKRYLKKYLKDKAVTKNVDPAILSRLRKLVGLEVEGKAADDLKAAREEFFDTWAAFALEKYTRVGDAADAFIKYMESPKLKDEAKKLGIDQGVAYDMVKKAARQFKLTEAPGKVHTLPNPGFKPRGAPEVKARAFDKPGTDRSTLDKSGKGKYFAVEFADEGEWIYVLIARDDTPMTFSPKKDPNDEYHGIYLSFFPDGKIDADTHDVTAKRQWIADKDKIIKAAKDALKDKDLPNIYDGLGGKSVKRGTGKLSFDTDGHVARDDKKMSRHRSDEGKEMITFKEFLSEAKPPMKRVKEPGWYVVDNVDKPIEGPMTEGGARERADELNAGKKGGDIPEFDVLYFSDYEIRRAKEKESY